MPGIALPDELAYFKGYRRLLIIAKRSRQRFANGPQCVLVTGIAAGLVSPEFLFQSARSNLSAAARNVKFGSAGTGATLVSTIAKSGVEVCLLRQLSGALTTYLSQRQRPNGHSLQCLKA